MPHVAAILVVHNGMAWLPSVLQTLGSQNYERLDLMVVDNASTDGSTDLLRRRLPQDRLIVMQRNVGFGQAVNAAVRHDRIRDAEYLLLLHDDLVLQPDAVERLVATALRDPEVAIVGPKLREWLDEPILQEVGMTIDRYGRAERSLERGELDQGQHDGRRDVLYVSTAGMLVRAGVLRQLGGFDPRFRAFRDDLDLCWRAWLAGWRVEVAAEAVGYHIAAYSGRLRPGTRHGTQARYLSERHAVAAVLKNYSAVRLAWILPVMALLSLAKVGAFLMTRRFAAAGAAGRAYAWNVRHLAHTLRLRASVQRSRKRTDAELSRLFAPGLPRVREYAEVVRHWLAGGGTASLDPAPEVPEPEVRRNPVARAVGDHPVATAGAILGLVYLAGAVSLLGSGQLVLGEVLPWPADVRDFLRSYASPWGSGALGTADFASPIQAVLGAVSLLGFGSAWAAQRLVVLGLVPLAWLIALRAGRLLTSRPGPRVLGATLYALSPPVLGALANGRFGELVVAAVLPGLVLMTARTASSREVPASAWRCTSLLSLGLAVAAAAAPSLWVLLVPLYLCGLVAAALPEAGGRGRPVLRMSVAGAGALAMLGPWLLDLSRLPDSWLPDAPAAALPAWRALLVAPLVLPGMEGLAGMLAAATVGAVLVLALVLGLRLRPGLVAGMIGIVVVSAAGAWLAWRMEALWVWDPALLLPAALAIAGLATLSARSVREALVAHAFGLRQVTVALAAVVLVAGLAGGIVRVGTGPYDAYELAPEWAPAFVMADEARVGPYRVLLLRADAGVVHWDVTDASGPSMLQFGTRDSDSLERYLDGGIAAAIGGADPTAGARLGLAGIRYVVLSDTDSAPELAAALREQPDLEPTASGDARVFRVRSWLPRAVVLPQDAAQRVLAGEDPGDTRDFEERILLQAHFGEYAALGGADAGVLVVNEEQSGGWTARSANTELPRVHPEDPDLPVNAFEVPDETRFLGVEAGGGGRHRTIVVLQTLAFLAVLSLALRPPGFTQAASQHPTGRRLPMGIGVLEDGGAGAGHSDEAQQGDDDAGAGRDEDAERPVDAPDDTPSDAQSHR